MDGGSRGKPGLAGIGGVLHNCKGKVLIMFSKYVGVCDSNEAEVLAILEGLHLFSSRYSGMLIMESYIPLTQSHGCLSERLILGSFIST